ncbi:MAG: hypothetical protein WC728_05180 [Elusimicrobiota bacterium]
MRLSRACLACGLLLAVSGGLGAEEDRAALLREMIHRRIVSAGSSAWSSEQYAQLMRLREAEALGAFDLLRARLGTLRTFVAEAASGSGPKTLYLNAAGYQRFTFLLSQEARAYFESKGAEARFIFRLKTLGGKKIFDSTGLLTQEGLEVYIRIKRRLPVFWKYPDGTVMGNVRPPKTGAPVEPPSRAEKDRAPGTAAPKPQDPQETAASQKIATLIKTGYVEVSETEVQFLTKATGLATEQLQKESSLQIVPTREKIYFLLSPSDPLMALVARYRSGGEAPKATP